MGRTLKLGIRAGPADRVAPPWSGATVIADLVPLDRRQVVFEISLTPGRPRINRNSQVLVRRAADLDPLVMIDALAESRAFRLHFPEFVTAVPLIPVLRDDRSDRLIDE